MLEGVWAIGCGCGEYVLAQPPFGEIDRKPGYPFMSNLSWDSVAAPSRLEAFVGSICIAMLVDWASIATICSEGPFLVHRCTCLRILGE